MEAAYHTGIAPFSASKVLNCCERAWRGGGAPGRSLRLPPSARIARLLLEVYPQARMGVFLASSKERLVSDSRVVRIFPPSWERGCSRPRPRLRSPGAPEGGVPGLPALGSWPGQQGPGGRGADSSHWLL